MKERIERAVREGVGGIFNEAHEIAKTKSGDISISQSIRLAKIEKNLTELIEEQVKQNL
ncbi:MAG: hypothetical protein ACXAAH_15595 [Promethearchaeota archaeon]|jgi:hypothetical protein